MSVYRKILATLTLIGQRPVPIVSAQAKAAAVGLIVTEATVFGILPAADHDAVVTKLNAAIGILFALWAALHLIVAALTTHQVTPSEDPRTDDGTPLVPLTAVEDTADPNTAGASAPVADPATEPAAVDPDAALTAGDIGQPADSPTEGA